MKKLFCFFIAQDVDKVNRLTDSEKRCKARKRGLQMRAHTRTYVTDFAARVDERTEDPAVQGFGSAALESKGFARAGRASVNRSATAVQ